MTTFLIGLCILIGGGYLYGRYCERVFGPDERQTPALERYDGVDFLPMKGWKNALVELLNIAGTGPIFGAIQGILFGPIAFLAIPIGCVFVGSMHDYFTAMISMRDGGSQVPALVRRHLGGGALKVYNIFLYLLLFLVGVVFVYTPGDLIVSQVLNESAVVSNPTIWIVYALIFLYYLAATIFPIDAIIGRIYPVFGLFLLLSAVGIFVSIIVDGGAHLAPFSLSLFAHPDGLPFIPVFFITVACGIMSGFHATQATMISRTVRREQEGRMTFFNMMLVEGFVAMVWAAGAMIVFRGGTPLSTAPADVVGLVCRSFLGPIGGMIAIIGVIVLPITTGDTAMRSLRLLLAEQFSIDQKSAVKRILLATAFFIPVVVVLYIAKSNPKGFNILWRYFAFTNQFIGVFALGFITVYLRFHGKNYFISLIPAMFYAFVTLAFIIHAPIGLKLDQRLGLEATSYLASFIAAGLLSLAYGWWLMRRPTAARAQ